MIVQNIKLDLCLPGPLQGTLNSASPTVSWQVLGDEENWIQHSYQIKVRYESEANWEEYGETVSSRTQFVSWPGRTLKSRASFEISVRVKGQATEFSDWSYPVKGQVGFLTNEEEWPAKFIAISGQKRVEELRAPESLFRKEFSVNKKVASAKVWSTALGIYELELNGLRVANDFLSPGWTTYEKRLLHQMYDVTELVSQGTNVIGARVGAGWYSGKFGFDGGLVNIYGEKRAVSLFVDIQYEDSTRAQICTDETWNSSYGPLVAAGLYDGEMYDANKEISGWSSNSAVNYDWQSVDVVTFDSNKIVPQSFPHVTEQRRIFPKLLPATPSGKKILDYGENIVGFVAFKDVVAPKGYNVQFKFAEVMEHGELGTRPLREARATDVYIFKGAKEGELYMPRFTFHGFRYCQIEDPNEVINIATLEAIVISTNMRAIGGFECDNEMLNALHDNVIRSTRGNFITLPTDCPQRDERMGWTGDIAIFGKTASFLFDCTPMLSNWLIDLWCEQELKADSKFPFAPPVTVPNIIKYMNHFWDDQISAIWLDCAVYLPKSLYDSTEATFILKQQYNSMKKWIECLPMVPGKVLWNQDKVPTQLGDWLDPLAPPDHPLKAVTDAYLVADAFLYLILCFMVEISSLVTPEDILKFTNMAANCKTDFLEAYVNPSGQMVSDTQTAYSLAICFGLFSDEIQVQYAGNRLSEIVTANDFKIGTGFAGTPFVARALFTTGHPSDAYSMLLQKKCPSWLYPVSMGATTIWERWNSMMPDGTINPGEMTSFNHYALGAVASTMHEIIGGVEIIEPGYKKFRVKPQPGGGLNYCKVYHDSPYGRIDSTWKVSNGYFSLNVTVPLNTTAVIQLPDNSIEEVGSGAYTFLCDFLER